MALPYKLLKSITINGVTNGLDPDLGHLVTEDSETYDLSEWVGVIGAEVTLTEPGTYFISNVASYMAGGDSSLTANMESLLLQKNGESSAIHLADFTQWFPAYLDQWIPCYAIIEIETADVPARVYTFLASGTARNNCDSHLQAYKLIRI